MIYRMIDYTADGRINWIGAAEDVEAINLDPGLRMVRVSGVVGWGKWTGLYACHDEDGVHVGWYLGRLASDSVTA